MTQEFKKGDKVRILNHSIYANEQGVIKTCRGVSIDTGKGREKGCLVKLDKNGIEPFSVSDLEKLS